MATSATPNLVLDPQSSERKALLFKLEDEYGVDAEPTGLVNWIEMRNPNFTAMDAQTASRNIAMPYFGGGGEIVTGASVKLSADIALVASGVPGTPPKWSELAQVCGFAETIVVGESVTLNLVSDGIPSATGYLTADRTRHDLLGIRGEMKYKATAGEIPLLTFDFTALYREPEDASMPTVVRTGWPIEEPINKANTAPIKLNGVDLSFSAFEWSLGNKVSFINQPGFEAVRITERELKGSVTVIAVPLASFNPYALAQSGELVNIVQQHGSVAGKKVSCPMKVSVTGVGDDKIDGMKAWKISFTGKPDAGNDEVALVLT